METDNTLIWCLPFTTISLFLYCHTYQQIKDEDKSEETLILQQEFKALSKTDQETELNHDTSKYNNSKKRCNLYVKGFPPNMNEDDLKIHFGKFGDIESIKLYEVNNKHESPFAYVCYKTPKQAYTAKTTLKHINNIPLHINNYEIKQHRNIEVNKNKQELQLYQAENQGALSDFKTPQQEITYKNKQAPNSLINLPKKGHIELKRIDIYINIDKELQTVGIEKLKEKFNYLANRFCADTMQLFLNFQGPNFKFQQSDAFHLFSSIELRKFIESTLLNIQDNKVVFKILVDICIGIVRVIQIRVKEMQNYPQVDYGHMKVIEIQIKTIININSISKLNCTNEHLLDNINVVIQQAYQIIKSVLPNLQI